MHFNFVSMLLYLMITFDQILYGRTCDCTFCFDHATVSAGGESRIYNEYLCPAGTAAAVSEINVQSTDQSGFQIYTKDDPSSSESYTAGSTTSTVTCFNMGDGFVVGGRQPRIYVIIRCEEWSQPCSVRYTIDLVCTHVGTTSTAKSTSISTIKPTSVSTIKPTSISTIIPTSISTIIPTSMSTTKPVDPSTVTTVVFDNICECQCCKGSAVCNPVYVGIIFYGTSKCEASDCASQCAKQFSDCPVNRTEPGKIVTHCRNNAGIMLKSSFYVPVLVIISIHIFNII